MNLEIRHIKKTYFALLIIIVVLLTGTGLVAQDLEKVMDLSGQWRFSIGHDPAWSEKNFDDSDWERIKTPSAWELEGFNGYNGYAWYRKSFNFSPLYKNQTYYLELGYIDDVDEVFVNGKRIGRTGSFPPDYSTAYNARRLYVIPSTLFDSTSILTIAIRIYDGGGEGGIIHGKMTLSYNKKAIAPDLNLQGEWKFKTGNCGDPAEFIPDFSTWDDIIVPGTWEDQGYKHFDGIACYANEFKLNGQFKGKKMVILLGKIDDLDMVYLNGVLVGQSGAFTTSTADQRSEMYQQLRGYYFPENILNHNGINNIIVKVYDHWGVGGIWDGDIGLITQDNYITYWRKIKETQR